MKCGGQRAATGAKGLEARLHVAAGLGGDGAALLQAVPFGADDLQIEGAGVIVLVEPAG